MKGNHCFLKIATLTKQQFTGAKGTSIKKDMIRK